MRYIFVQISRDLYTVGHKYLPSSAHFVTHTHGFDLGTAQITKFGPFGAIKLPINVVKTAFIRRYLCYSETSSELELTLVANKNSIYTHTTLKFPILPVRFRVYFAARFYYSLALGILCTAVTLSIFYIPLEHVIVSIEEARL